VTGPEPLVIPHTAHAPSNEQRKRSVSSLDRARNRRAQYKARKPGWQPADRHLESLPSAFGPTLRNTFAD
jgi:hypothetical protein